MSAAPVAAPAPVSAADSAAAQRGQRYHQAEDHELVKELLARFDADIRARVFTDRAAWLAQFDGGTAAAEDAHGPGNTRGDG